MQNHYLLSLIGRLQPVLKTYLLLSAIFVSFLSKAQFPYSETFKNTSAKNLVVSGSSRLTAATGIDVAGDGYLRLTENANYNVGYVYGIDSFASNYGITATFEFFSHKPAANSTNQADGMTFFLFDASVNAFRPGGTGGSLGYAQYYATPGMAKGYIGISIDAFGNFSNPTDGTKNGGPGQRRSSVAIRGPGDGRGTSDYVYQTGVTTTDAPYNVGFNGFTQRYPDSTNVNYRKIKIILIPGSSLGPALGYKVTIIMYKGGATVTPVTLISNFDYPFIAPARLQYGLAASTGSISNYHEIRNLTIEATNSNVLLPPVLSNDIGLSACYGQMAIMDVTSNDVSVNAGGVINKTTVDLDPSTAGIQKTYTDVGKGSYSVDSNGIVSFMPQTGFVGASIIAYKVNDTYGVTANASASLTFNVSNANAPLLSLSNPSPVCLPATVNITGPLYKTVTSPGATYDYFSSLTDANAGTNNINLTASSVSTSGTYYVKATLNGCSTVKPIVVESATAPTVANAGSDQSFCNSTGAQNTTLIATNPNIGAGTWSQVSGPAAIISYPDAATTPLYNLSKGVYVFRYTVANGACAASIDDIQVSVGIAASAGSVQTVVNANGVTLAANSAFPATGVWSQISGPTAGISDLNSPGASLTGLTPGNTYVMQWKIVNGACASTSQVTITNVLNTPADAGADQMQTGFLTVSLHGNTPGVGNTGTWSITNAPAGSVAVIVSPSSPTSTFTGLSKVGDYTLRWTIANGSYSNYDEMSLRVTSVLPVTWLSFEAKDKGDEVMLDWQTGTEINNDHFNVERSIDGVHFTVVGKVVASNHPQGGHYLYVDYIGTLASEKVFYRIVQVDKDLNYSYSGIRFINREQDPKVAVWPNPIRNVLHLSIVTAFNDQVQIAVFDSQGRLLLLKEEQFTRGKNTISIKEVGSLSQGLFYVRISGKKVEIVSKFLKN